MLSWSLILTVVAVLAVAYREYRWSVENGNLKGIVDELNKDLDATLNALWINAITGGFQGVCSQDDPEKSCSTQEQHNKYKSVEELQTMVTKHRDEIMKKVSLNVTTMLKHVPSLFNLSGLFNCFLLLLLGMYEIYVCHHGVLYTESNEAKSWIKNDNLYFGNRKYRRFIATKLPLSNCILFFIISVSGIIPWCNIGWMSKESYIGFVLRVVLHWIMMSKLALWTYNFVGIVRYLPATYAEYKKKLWSIEWWILLLPSPILLLIYLLCLRWTWFLQKIFLADPVVHTIGRYAVTIYLSLPWFYYYYYRHLCTRSKEDFGDSWFLLNTLMSLAFLYSVSFFIRVVTFGTPSWMTRLIRVTEIRLFTLIILTVIGFAIVCLRSMYFLWASSCSWVGTAITWVFLHSYLVELLEIYPFIFILLGKIQHNNKQMDTYVMKFNDLIKLLGPAESTNEKAATNERLSDEVISKLSARLYDAFIYKSMRDYILGVGAITNENREERLEAEKNAGKGEGKAVADEELDKVFNLHVFMLHGEIDEKLQNLSKDSTPIDLSNSFETMMSDYLGVHV